MASTPSKPVLGYWNIRGLAQPIRLLLAYLEVDYEDKYFELTPQLTKDNWHAVRDVLDLDFPNLPYLLDGSQKVTESRAIMKYFCRTRKPELLGKTIEAQTQVDTVDNFMYDLVYCGFIPVLYQHTEALEKKYKELLPVRLRHLSKFLKEKLFIAGDCVTYVDFFVYEVLDQIRTFDSKCLDEFSNLQAYESRIENLPQIKKYMSSSAFLKAPLYGKNAIIKI
jgi:glutathione S-transferase